MNGTLTELERVRAALTGRYAIERELGVGGMATVYLAQDLRHDRRVAVKVLHQWLANTVGTERFLQEIRILGALHHPHILPLYDSGATDGYLYYVTPYVVGDALRVHLKALGRLPLELALQIADEILDALGYAHRQGIVHRDIKPENILLIEGHAVLADFGIARASWGRGVQAEESRRATDETVMVGTAEYMSPEQAAGDTVDGRSDLYSFACVLYETLTGTPPFPGQTDQQIVASRFRSKPPDVRATCPEAPRALAELISRCLELAPEQRFPTAEAVRAELKAIEDTLPVARHRSFGTRRWRAWAATLGLGAVVAALLLTVLPRHGSLPRIAVVGPGNETGDTTYNALGDLIADRIVDKLDDRPSWEIVTVPHRALFHLPRDEQESLQRLERLRAVGDEMRAGILVWGSLYSLRDSLEIDLEIADVRSGDVLRALGPFRVAVSNPEPALDAVGIHVTQALDSLARVGRLR